MASSPQISILLPCLNSRQFLQARVDSLLAQTFGDWEAIVLDSHSTDGSWEFFESVAKIDSRFRLYQIPCQGLYAALNRGLELATGEFLYIAPCDDTMAPEFFAAMLEALARCMNAGIAVCDCSFINRDGHELSAKDMADHLSKRSIRNLLRSGTVRTALSRVSQQNMNYRPPPHDCLLHFTGRSVYFSLTQLLVRTALAKAAGPFETTAGSAADFGWLVRLTRLTGSVHLPKHLATWRFHGNQLSLHRDETRLIKMKQMCESVLPEICQGYPPLLTRNDCELLLLPYKTLLSAPPTERIGCWLESFVRVLRMLFEQPSATLRALFQTISKIGIRRQFGLALIFHRIGLCPRELDAIR